MENKIYKEAILDAKALRASAIANAKSMMQEAIEPAIQEMMRLKLSEELEEEGYEEEGYDHAENIEEYGDEHEMSAKDAMQEDNTEEVTDATLEEILAELDGLEEDETLNEAEDEEEAEEEAEEESTEDVGDDTKVVELTLGDLKAALFPQMSSAPEGEEAPAEDEEAPISLDEILAELEEKEHGSMEEEERMEESIFTDPNFYAGLVGLLGSIGPLGYALIKDLKQAKTPEEKKSVFKQAANAIAKATGGEQLEESVFTDPNFYAGLVGLLGSIGPIGAIVLKDLKKAKTPEERKKVFKQAANAISKATGGEQMEETDMYSKTKLAEELAIAKRTIATLRESVNEINLLNAKLLYMNKIFKAKNLAESEKVKVIKAFDRNTSVKEVKNTYETLKESLQTKKTQLKESVGFASKPIGSVAKNNIIEADPFINRWQKIAGIK